VRDRGCPWAALAALFGVGFFLWCYGLAALDGTYVDWLASGDRSQTFLGWHFYRRADLSFPLGAIPRLAYPVGSSLAYSDAIPWFALLLAPLSPLLPETYQIAGLWLLLAYALQGVLAFVVLERLLGDRAIALAGSALIVTSPALARRGGHLSLCAHWLLLAALAAFLATRNERDVRRFLLWWLPLLIVAGGTHPYLTAMTLALALAACANGTPLARLRLRDTGGTHDDRSWMRTVALRLVAVVATTSLSLYAFGYIGAPTLSAGGFGELSTHLLAFVDPDGGSRLLPDLPSLASREGHGFLGAGTLLLLGIAATARLLRRTSAPASAAARLRVELAGMRLLALAMVGLAAYALGPRIFAASLEVATLRGFYASLEPLPSIFRASGRFLWPLHLAVMLGAVVLVATTLRRRSTVVAIVAVAAALQAWDGIAAYRGNDVTLVSRPHRALSRSWEAAGRSYREIRLVPPSFANAECPGDTRPGSFYVRFAELAARHGMRINSAHFSRHPHEALAAACRAVEDEVAVGSIDPEVVYVVSDAAMHRFSAAKLGLATCGRLDGVNVCTSSARRTRFAALVPARLEPPGACADILTRPKRARGPTEPSRVTGGGAQNPS